MLTPEALDELERLHAAASPPRRWDRSWDNRPYPCDGYPWSTYAIGPQHGTPQGCDSDEDREASKRAAAARNADVAVIHALVNAAPALIAAARDRDAARAEVAHLRAELAEARADLAELRATLDNERGEGRPPVAGWVWRADQWINGLWTVYEESRGVWVADRDGEAVLDRPTARAAMRAASEAR